MQGLNQVAPLAVWIVHISQDHAMLLVSLSLANILGLEPNDLADSGAPDHGVGLMLLDESLKELGAVMVGRFLVLAYFQRT